MKRPGRGDHLQAPSPTPPGPSGRPTAACRAIPVLMYHDVFGSGTPPPADDPYAVSEQQLAETLAGLKAEGFAAVTLDELFATDAPELAGRRVLITFDDAREGVLRWGLPALRREGWAAVVYAISGRTGRSGYLDGAGLRTLALAGWTVGTHGVTHRHLSGLPRSTLDWEWQRSRATLEALVGHAVRHASLPGGRGGRREAHSAAAAGLWSLGTSVPGIWRWPEQPMAMPRIAVRTAHAPGMLVRLARGARGPMLQARLRHGILEGAKRVLGDSAYDALRRRLTGADAGEAG